MPATAVLLLVTVGLLADGRLRQAAAQDGGSVTYSAGWNLIGAPTATLLEQASGPAYVLGPSSSGYQALGLEEEIGGRGAWVFFPRDTTLTLGRSASEFSRTLVPAGQYVIVGNPSATQTLAISGADHAFSYDPLTGYTAVTELAPGRGAFVFSTAGGEITLGKMPSGSSADAVRAIQRDLAGDPRQRAPFDRLAAVAVELLRNRDYASLQSTLDDATAATEDGLRAKGSALLPSLDTVQRNAFAMVREALSEARTAVQAGQLAQADAALDAARRAAQAAQDDAIALARTPTGSARYLDVTPQTLARYGALIRGALPAIVAGIPHGDDFWGFAQALLAGQPPPAFGLVASAPPTAALTPSPMPTTAKIPLDFFVSCTSGGELCSPSHTENVITGGVLEADLIAGGCGICGHCSDIIITLFVDGTSKYTTGKLGPLAGNADSGLINLGPVSPGEHVVGFQATGVADDRGCNHDTLGSWGAGGYLLVSR